MGKTEAFCTQCGSLIMIDDGKEKSKCLFCGNEMVTAKALDLKSDPKTRVMIQKEAEAKAIEIARAKKQQQKLSRDAKAVPAVAVPVTKEVVVIRPLPLKTKLTIFGVFLGIILVLTGIFVPTILSRNEKREIMNAQLNVTIPFAIQDQGIAYKFNDNRELLLVTNVDVKESVAIDAFREYAVIYGKSYNITPAKAQARITVKVFAKNGLFVCEEANGAVVAKFTTSTPTPTPSPVPVSSTASSDVSTSASASK